MELLIKETLERLLEVMGIPFTGVRITKEGEKTYYTEIDTENSSLLIGWHGETIGALQHLLKCLLYKQGADPEAQVVLDVDHYKKRQEESVVKLAERKAEMALQDHREIRLPPMNPYFRRKVHTFLANDPKFKEKVTTESYGEGEDRQVVIIPR